MKGSGVIHFNIGNIGISASLQGFSTIRDKSGATMHSHAEFEYHFVFSGNALIKFEDEAVSLGDKDSILVFPDTFHKFLPCETESNILSISFSVKKCKRGENYYEAIERAVTQRGFAVLEATPLITDLIHTIMSGFYSDTLFSFEETRSGFALLLTRIFSRVAPDKSDTVFPTTVQEIDLRVYIMEEYFNEHYMEKITLSALSQRLHLSEKQTERMIKKTYGVCFCQQLAKIRIKSAMELLSETEKSVAEISETVGYDSYNGFYSAFKRITGTTPVRWREEEAVRKKRSV